MNKSLILLLGLLALALLGYFCIYKNHGPAIQDDILSRSSAAIADGGLDWADVSVSGRNITLTGVAPTEAARNQVEELAKIRGYNLIDNQITVATAAPPVPATKEVTIEPVVTDPYIMKAVLDDQGKVKLSGYVPDDNVRAEIVALAEEKHGAGNVIDQLETVAAAPGYWTTSVKGGLGQMAQLIKGQAEWRDQKLTVTGLVASEDIKQQLVSQTNQTLPEEVTAQYNLTVGKQVVEIAEPVVSPPVMTKEEQAAAVSCQDQFADLLSRSIIVFRTASAEIDPGSFALLDRLTDVANECPAAAIQIEGHTDSRGNSEYNQTLSQQRAQSVVDYLATNGIDSSRLTAIGFGEEIPIADNENEEGRQLNRRIEFKVKGL